MDQESLNPNDSGVQSDEGELSGEEDGGGNESGGNSPGDKNNLSAANRRAHHNALERKRRDHIKDRFNNLRDSVPSLNGEKVSRAQILKHATEYIQIMRKKNAKARAEIEEVAKENRQLEEQIRLIEKQKSTVSSNITLNSFMPASLPNNVMPSSVNIPENSESSNSDPSSSLANVPSSLNSTVLLKVPKNGTFCNSKYVIIQNPNMTNK